MKDNLGRAILVGDDVVIMRRSLNARWFVMGKVRGVCPFAVQTELTPDGETNNKLTFLVITESKGIVIAQRAGKVMTPTMESDL